MERRGRATQDGGHVARIFAVLVAECNGGHAAEVPPRVPSGGPGRTAGGHQGAGRCRAALDGEELLDWIRERHVEDGERDDASGGSAWSGGVPGYREGEMVTGLPTETPGWKLTAQSGYHGRMGESWVNRERRTSRLVRLCYDTYRPARGASAAEFFYALCRLTWVNADNGDDTAAIGAPAMAAILRTELTARTAPELALELRELEVPADIADLAAHPVGFVRFYGAFRNVSKGWLRNNEKAVARILRAVATATDDNPVRRAYVALDSLPRLPRPGGGPGNPSSLITPLLACLDARGRAPIINGRKIGLVRKLGLGSASLVDQYDGLVGLIGQAGINDAFDLDVADEEQIDRAMKRTQRPSRERPRHAAVTGSTGTSRDLGQRRDDDVEYLRTVNTGKMRRLHNKMTNSLRTICADAGLSITEGADQDCLYDALIARYAGTERSLLIEVKTDVAPPLCRMAVGQLLDYRRKLVDRAGTDLAVLLPEEPPKDAIAFFGYVGVKVMWFAPGMKRIGGDVRIGSGRK